MRMRKYCVRDPLQEVCGIKRKLIKQLYNNYYKVLTVIMSGVAILLSVLLLATVLICHRVSGTSTKRYDEAKLSAEHQFIMTVEIYGRYYYKNTGIPLQQCCLTFKSDLLCRGRIPTFNANCTCNFVYQHPECNDHNEVTLFGEAVQNRNGSAVIITTEDLDEAAMRYVGDPSLIIPIILVSYDKSIEFFKKLYEEPYLTAKVEISTTDPGNKLNSSRSATTFYFVVFAFTILLLLSLTWFVFNYLRRCHHMYTVKRQRAEMLSKTRRAINKCPTKTYKKIKKAAQKNISKDDVGSVISEEEDRCPICLETFKMKDMLRVLPCQHEFHKPCIDPWLFEKGTCPMCKLSIVGNHDECYGEQMSQDLRILNNITMEMEEGISTESSYNNAHRQQNSVNESMQVESIE